MGAIAVIIKCRRGKGTKFVWNSFRSPASSPSKHSDAVIDDMAFAMRQFSVSYEGRLMLRCFGQISYIASLSNSTEISVRRRDGRVIVGSEATTRVDVDNQSRVDSAQHTEASAVLR